LEERAVLPIETFVINLERDVERRRYMTEVLAEAGLQAEFAAAVDGQTLSEADWAAYDRDRCHRVYGVDMLAAEIGCYLSHYRLWRRIVRVGLDFALIFEDDAVIGDGFAETVESIVSCRDAGWLVVRLSSLRPKVVDAPSPKFEGSRVAELHGGAGLYLLTTHVLGAGAYLLKREGAERLIAYGRRIFMPLDHTMDRYWENGIRPYVVRPFLVRQRDDLRSSIGARPPDRRHDQPVGVRARRRLQRFEDSLRKRLFNARHGSAP
jgi:glycosyl transferase family 25